MKTETMTIHEALAELKLLDSRIKNKIQEGKFAVANKHSNKQINGVSAEDFIANASSTYQSIVDLMARRRAIRNAVSLSNAMTKVIIRGNEYTIAEAIEMKKTGINNYADLAFALSSQLNLANNTIKNANETLEKMADQYVIGLFGAKDKNFSAEAMNVREAYINANSLELITLPKIEEFITDNDDFIKEFLTEVDSKLSVSNALTTITIEY